MENNEIAWDISPLLPSAEMKDIQDRKNLMTAQVDSFVSDFKGKIGTFGQSPESILNLLQKYEDFNADIAEYMEYCSLIFSANMVDEKNQQLFNEMQSYRTVIEQKLTFLDLELGKLLSDIPELVNSPILAKYKHYLERVQDEFPHNLSELEENLILEKNQFGINAWSTLQSAWLNTRKMDVQVEGETKNLSYGEANALLSHSDRSTRLSANKAIYSKLGEDELIFSTAMRSVCSDWVKTYKRRHFQTSLGQSLLASDTNHSTIMNLMNTVKSNVPVYQDYLKTKAKLMDLPKLGCEDLMAPLAQESSTPTDWNSAKEIILTAFGNFDPEIKEFVEIMYDNDRIDASPRFGKRNGAFCSDWSKGKSAFVFITYNNKIGDLYTLGHELGHAVHAHYVHRNQSLLNTHLSMCVAETASIFGELLITDLLMEKAQDNAEKCSLLTHILDEAGMAIFQVGSRFWFEMSMYDEIEKGTNLNGDKISELWTSARNDTYGDAVEWFDEMRWEWAMKPHYYIPNFRFYNYPYVYAQLFVFSLYKLYKQDRLAFVPKFKELLKVGSSMSATDVGKIMGLDTSSPEFWKLGLDLYQEFATQLKELMD
ncbi:MAG: M3 family metallopeptidase [Promethearchaeota archaeon]